MPIEEVINMGFNWIEISNKPHTEIEINSAEKDGTIDINIKCDTGAGFININQEELKILIDFLQRQIV